jgi:hypothetical protein
LPVTSPSPVSRAASVKVPPTSTPRITRGNLRDRPAVARPPPAQFAKGLQQRARGWRASSGGLPAR